MPTRDEVIAELAVLLDGYSRAVSVDPRNADVFAREYGARADALIEFFAAEPGVAVPEFVNETDEPADPTQAAIYWQRRLTDAQEAIYQAQGVFDAVRDLLWRATQYGETDDGDTAAYIVSKGTVHRLVGAMVAAGESAPLRNAGVAVPEPDEQVILPCGCGDVRKVYVQHGRGCKLCDECGGIYPDCDCRPAASPVAQEDQP